jgi:hypothetical protein
VASNVTVSSVADSKSNTYTSRASSSATGASVSAYAYIYLANLTTVPARGTALAITVTFSASGANSVSCADVVGVPNRAPRSTESVTGTATSAHSDLCATSPVDLYCTYGLWTGSLTPNTGDFVISAAAASFCSTDYDGGLFINLPADDDWSTAGYFAPYVAGQTGSWTGASCGSGGKSFYLYGVGAFKQIWSTGSTYQNYTGTRADGEITANSANFTEISAAFIPSTLVVKDVSESVGFAVGTLKNQANTESLGLGVLARASQIGTEVMGLFVNPGTAQIDPSPQMCLGIEANLTDGDYIVDTGPVCGAPVVAGATFIAACNFFQLQCWAIPLMYLGMIDGFFVGIAGTFRVSEKSFMYLTFAGLTWGSLVEISLGIMTPMLPVLLIAMNIAYSFRLDKIVLSAVNSSGGGGRPQQ